MNSYFVEWHGWDGKFGPWTDGTFVVTASSEKSAEDIGKAYAKHLYGDGYASAELLVENV